MINLLEETCLKLEKHGKSLEDIVWVGCWDFEIDKDNFIELAKTTNYDPGYGAQEVAEDLIIVGDDWWMERWEYDGSEGWKFNRIPLRPERNLKVFALKRCGWQTLNEMNFPDKDKFFNETSEQE